jgi:hypothetical protein
MTAAILFVILALGVAAGTWGHLNWGNQNQFAGAGIGLGTVVVIALACYLLGWL